MQPALAIIASGPPFAVRLSDFYGSAGEGNSFFGYHPIFDRLHTLIEAHLDKHYQETSCLEISQESGYSLKALIHIRLMCVDMDDYPLHQGFEFAVFVSSEKSRVLQEASIQVPLGFDFSEVRSRAVSALLAANRDLQDEFLLAEESGISGASEAVISSIIFFKCEHKSTTSGVMHG